MRYEVRDATAYISFNRPEKHNARRDEDIESLVAALNRLDGDDSAHLGIMIGLPVASFLPRLVDSGEHVTAATELARLILGDPPPAVREHVRARRTITATQVALYQDFSSEFMRADTSDTSARAAVAAHSAGLGVKR